MDLSQTNIQYSSSGAYGPQLYMAIGQKLTLPTRDFAETIILEAAAKGIDQVELIRRLLSLDRLANWYDMRRKGDGGRIFKEIDFHSGSVRLKTHDDRVLVYDPFIQWRQRWKLDGRRTTRTDAELSLGVWPGYLDAIEEVSEKLASIERRLVREIYERGERLKNGIKEENEEYEAALMDWHEKLRMKAANERHPLLRLWRDRNPLPTPSEVPEKLRHIKKLKRLETSNPCHVYFLLRSGEVVYVGQTASAWPNRIASHLKDDKKIFDDVWYLEVDRPSLRHVEQRFIDEFNPIYNKRQTQPQ